MNQNTRFMKLVFPNLVNEYITITRIDNTNIVQERHFNNVDDAITYATGIDKSYWNTYYSVTTTDGIGRSTDNLKTRNCICLDYDKKELGENFNHIDILHKFKNIRCFYHCIIDTGHGYHVYIFIEPTTDLKAVEEVTKCLAMLTGADTKATLPTQLMRVPGTVNIKEAGKKNHKRVNIVYLADDSKIKLLPISHYQYNYVTESTKNTNIQYVMRDNHIPNCVTNILKNGSKVGNRNSDLQILVVALKRMGKTLAEIKSIVAEWLNNTETMDDLHYQVEYMYNNLYNGVLNCTECPHKGECYTRGASQTVINDGFNELKFPNRDLKLITNSRSKRKGVRMMDGDMLVLYGILLNHNKGMFKDEITKELTYKLKGDAEYKCCFSDKVIRETLKKLEDNKFIDVSTVERKKFYKLKPNRVKDELKVSISFGAVYNTIIGVITPSELQLYCYMKYLNKVTPPKRGEYANALTINQDELARDLGITRERVTQMIQNLLDRRAISINYRAKSRNSGFMYNSYLLNY